MQGRFCDRCGADEVVLSGHFEFVAGPKAGRTVRLDLCRDCLATVTSSGQEQHGLAGEELQLIGTLNEALLGEQRELVAATLPLAPAVDCDDADRDETVSCPVCRSVFTQTAHDAQCPVCGAPSDWLEAHRSGAPWLLDCAGEGGVGWPL